MLYMYDIIINKYVWPQKLTRMCEFHAKASEFLAQHRRLFVDSTRTGEVHQKTINRSYKQFSRDQLCLSGFCYHCSINVVFLGTPLEKFNAGQMHSSIYPSLSSTVYELLRDIGQKLQLFPIPLHLTPTLGVFPLEFRKSLVLRKPRIMGLQGSEDSLTIG